MYTNKTVVVTGGSRGVGRSLVEHFLDHNAYVVGISRGLGSVESERYSHFSVDLDDSTELQRTFFQIGRSNKTVDILINNAAVLTSQHAMIMPTSAATAMINTNFLGAFVCARECAKLMKKGKWGRIINIGSMAVSLEPIGDSVYAGCKAAMQTASNVMAKELSNFGITCNTLSISAIESDMLKQLPRDKIDAIVADLPIPRYAKIEDIVNVIDFFSSEKSSYITAQTVYLGGVN